MCRESTVVAAASVTNDVVVSQTQNVLDADGDTIETNESDLLPNTTPAPRPRPPPAATTPLSSTTSASRPP
jgi:hypothetical protein